jgi:hypothetical protein
MKIELADGKYTYLFYQDEYGVHQEALRYGELWRDLTGDNLIYTMAVKITELEEQLKETK